MSVASVTIDDVRAAERLVREHVSETPLLRSHALEKHFDLPAHRRVWLKDFGWTPSGSFKCLGALNWMANNCQRIGSRPVVAHSSGNFASGIAYAGMRFGKRVIVVMPDSAPKVKFELTQSFGAEIRTYNIVRDHQTGERDRMTREITDNESAVRASPYDDPHVIAGNGIGALEIVHELKRQGRTVSHFFCPVSGGGLMAGQAIAINAGFPDAQIVGMEPATANDFCQSLAAGARVRLDRPTSICDGLCSYDVGEHNWPILQRLVNRAMAIDDIATRRAMAWLYRHHGLRCEPSGTISLAAALDNRDHIQAPSGDIVVVLSGRNVDDEAFRDWIAGIH